MSRVLVLGGYGGFGARISLRLAALGHEVLVAGRSADKASRFSAQVAGAVPVSLDRRDMRKDCSGIARLWSWTPPVRSRR